MIPELHALESLQRTPISASASSAACAGHPLVLPWSRREQPELITILPRSVIEWRCEQPDQRRVRGNLISENHFAGLSAGLPASFCSGSGNSDKGISNQIAHFSGPYDTSPFFSQIRSAPSLPPSLCHGIFNESGVLTQTETFTE